LKRLHRALGATMIYVTHDQVEAMTLADRLVVLNQGIPQQVGTPTDVHDHPENRFVAGFIGSPPMNFLRKVERGVLLGVRPHQIVLGAGPHRARVDVTEPLGAEVLVHLDLDGEHLVARTESAPPPGEVAIDFRRVHRFDAVTERALP
jgi:ABC-type sugar transport system ATPase subunit